MAHVRPDQLALHPLQDCNVKVIPVAESRKVHSMYAGGSRFRDREHYGSATQLRMH